MPLPRRVAEFNRWVTNPLARLIAAGMPPFVIIEHRGRTSGRPYQTPVWGFFTTDELIIALTYGPGAEWVQNLAAAAGGHIVARGHRQAVGPPAVAHAIVDAPAIPLLIRRALRLARIEDYLRLPLTSGRMPI
ncbi:MAG: nitroreductase family deazaflavin-dependent oxidoreductase [Chloroflexia bacterium]|nr:nitroreductase family deazaflavin-dependent oxidoreductase [Chloroflexia bacterium]MDQ3411228.1 nitroreductase family deazaflavin-dependent oxidoreductase [Chloroflexota bacterium]